MAHAQNYLRALENLENTDLVEGIQEEKACIENILGLSIDPDDSDEDQDRIADKCEYFCEVASNDFSIKAMQRKGKRTFVRSLPCASKKFLSLISTLSIKSPSDIPKNKTASRA